MKKIILTSTGLALMLLANSPNITCAGVNGNLVALGNRPYIYIDSPPTFIYVPELGYSVAVESPYDFMYYDNYYYLYDSGYWYSSSFYDGPWVVITGDLLPPLLRGHRIPDIRRFRDIEYQKHDRQYWYNRDQHDRPSQRDLPINRNQGLFDGRGPNDGQRRKDDDGINRGDGRNGGDTRGPGNFRGGGEGHPPGGGRER